MRIDPVAVVHQYLTGRQDNLAAYVTGDLVGREPTQTAVYLEHTGGFRMVRDRMDRDDVTYQVYARERYDAAALAYKVREALLEELPGMVIGNVQVLDVSEVNSPQYTPDITSREHTYLGEVALYLIEA